MKITARDIMTSRYHTLTPETPVSGAINLFKEASRKEGRKIFGMMVLDDEGKLVGMLSMFDILLYTRPKHIHIWGMMEDLDIADIVDTACEKAGSVQVGDIMSPEVITIGPETHKFLILDIMIKKHVRRLPVVEDGQLLGIVYISDLFYDVLDRFTDPEI
ncbi:MAG: CBS domain-containing protein [Desulforhopalus sp.]